MLKIIFHYQYMFKSLLHISSSCWMMMSFPPPLITSRVTHEPMNLCVLECVCMNMHVYTRKSVSSEKAIMFSNDEIMSERLFEPLSSAAGSIMELWDNFHCSDLILRVTSFSSQTNVCLCSRWLNRAVV